MDKELIKKFWRESEQNNKPFVVRGKLYDFLLKHNLSKLIRVRPTILSLIGDNTLFSSTDGVTWSLIPDWDFEYDFDKKLLIFNEKKKFLKFYWWNKYKIRGYSFTKLELEGMEFTDKDRKIRIQDQCLYIKDDIDKDFVLVSKKSWDAVSDKNGCIHFTWVDEFKNVDDPYHNSPSIRYCNSFNQRVQQVTTPCIPYSKDYIEKVIKSTL